MDDIPEAAQIPDHSVFGEFLAVAVLPFLSLCIPSLLGDLGQNNLTVKQ